MELRDRLKQLRLERGLTQEQLAELADVSQKAISSYERGERKNVQGHILVRLAHALGVSSAYLAGETDDPKRDDRLPPEWVQTVEKLRLKGFTPEEVETAVRMIELARQAADEKE